MTPSNGLHGIATPDTEYVQLGDSTYEITPQPLPYLKRALGSFFEELTGQDVDSSNVADLITGRAHELLAIFIPDLMPRHQWEGYPTAVAYESDPEGGFDLEYSRTHSPSGPQVKLAVQAAFKANGLDLWKQLGSIVDPTMLRGLFAKALEGEDLFRSTPSPSSSSRSTQASDSETSTTTPGPTSPEKDRQTEVLGSPSPASTPS